MSMKSLGVVDSSEVLRRTGEDLRGDIPERALAEGLYINAVHVAIAASKAKTRAKTLGSPISEGEIVEPRDCYDCGNEIPEKRRRYAPNAIRCVTCQTKYE
jgi:phage/conjugal plasmid C-4 type zinc finger TraR family protein